MEGKNLYDLIKQEFPNEVKDLEQLRNLSLSNWKSENGLSAQLYWRNKIVLKGYKYIYKVDEIQSALARIIIPRYAEEEYHITPFLKPFIIPELSCGWFITTYEPICTLYKDKKNPNDKLKEIYGQSYIDLTKKLGIVDAAIHEKNLGYYHQNLKVFDWFGNYEFEKDENSNSFFLIQYKEKKEIIYRSNLYVQQNN